MSGPPPRLEALAKRLAGSFPEATPTRRRVGREAEYPVVDAAGRAADIAPLLERLARLPGHRAKRDAGAIVGVSGPVDYLLEVGRGTIELVSPAVDDLHALRSVHEAAMDRLTRAATFEGMTVLATGTQPLSPAEPALMSPKPRYQVMLLAMGPAWLGFAVTASDQLHVDIGRSEIVALTNLGNLLAPSVIALCANSPLLRGQVGAVCGRETALAGVFPEHNRHGMLRRPIASGLDWVQRIAEMPCLMIPAGRETQSYGPPFTQRAAELDRLGVGAGAQWTAFQHHERYVWNSARPRGALGTIELRAACQQPWASHDAACALNLGLVCAGAEIAAFVDGLLGPLAWERMVAWHPEVVRHGLGAPEPEPGLLAGILDRAALGLARRGLGEEALLAPMHARLAARRSPAHDAIDAFRTGGLSGFVTHAAIDEVP